MAKFRCPATLKALSVAATVLAASLAVGGAALAAPTAADSTVQQWAYGAHTSVTTSWSNGTGSYALKAFFGWDVLLTETNTSATTFELSATRAMALDFDLTYCKSPCAATSTNATLNFSAFETESGFANFTTLGTVYENGVAIPAIAISNGSDQVRSGVSESWSGTVHLLVVSHTVGGHFAVTAQAHVGVAFAPALGLVPQNLSTGTTWNSSSTYTATGGWSAAAAYARTPWNGSTTSESLNLSSALGGTGPLGLVGTDTGPVQLTNGVSTSGIGFVVEGPFALREGFLFLPTSADAFGGGEAAWADYSNGSAQATTATLDLGHAATRLGLLASATAFAPQPADPSTLGTVALLPATAASPSGGAVVQGQPESVAESQSGMNCLVAGTCQSSGGPGGPGHLLSGGLVVIVGVIVVATVLALVVVERRRIPPPTHPNAGLYPPGAAISPGAAPRPPAGAVRGAPPPPEEDPLGHLW